MPSTRTRLNYMLLTSSACSSFVRDARTRKMETACDAVRGSTLSGKILWGAAFIYNQTTPLDQ